MSATAVTAATRAPSGRRGLATLVRTEGRLFLRDPGGVFFALAFPAVLLLGMGHAVPGMRTEVEGVPGLEGVILIHLWGPVILATAIATVALTTLPATVAGYREHGIFRRLSTTPMRPRAVLASHVAVSGAALAVAVVLALVGGMTTLGIPLPESPLVVLAAFALATLALFAIGLIVGGLAPKASTASGIGMLLYFPLLFFAGLWLPISQMPDTLATVATFTPLGAASEAMTTAWFSGDLPWRELVVLAAWSAVGFPVAAKVFRWS